MRHDEHGSSDPEDGDTQQPSPGMGDIRDDDDSRGDWRTAVGSASPADPHDAYPDTPEGYDQFVADVAEGRVRARGLFVCADGSIAPGAERLRKAVEEYRLNLVTAGLDTGVSPGHWADVFKGLLASGAGTEHIEKVLVAGLAGNLGGRHGFGKTQFAALKAAALSVGPAQPFFPGLTVPRAGDSVILALEHATSAAAYVAAVESYYGATLDHIHIWPRGVNPRNPASVAEVIEFIRDVHQVSLREGRIGVAYVLIDTRRQLAPHGGQNEDTTTSVASRFAEQVIAATDNVAGVDIASHTKKSDHLDISGSGEQQDSSGLTTMLVREVEGTAAVGPVTAMVTKHKGGRQAPFVIGQFDMIGVTLTHFTDANGTPITAPVLANFRTAEISSVTATTTNPALARDNRLKGVTLQAIPSSTDEFGLSMASLESEVRTLREACSETMPAPSRKSGGNLSLIVRLFGEVGWVEATATSAGHGGAVRRTEAGDEAARLFLEDAQAEGGTAMHMVMAETVKELRERFK